MIPPFRKMDDPDVECYDPSKVIKSYNPRFVRAECAQERWTDRHFQWLMDYLTLAKNPQCQKTKDLEAQKSTKAKAWALKMKPWVRWNRVKAGKMKT